jgi:hypothetical protein
MEVTFQQKSKDEQQVLAGADAVLSPPRKGYTKSQRPSPTKWLFANSAEQAKNRFACCNKWGKVCNQANKAYKAGKAKIQLVFGLDLGCSAGEAVNAECLNFDLFASDVPFPARINAQQLKKKLAVGGKATKKAKRQAAVREHDAHEALKEVEKILGDDKNNGENSDEDESNDDEGAG